MSWLRNSPLRQSFSRNSSGGSRTSGRQFDATECDPQACYESFCRHWQQAYEIIQKSEVTRVQNHDDVLSVVNNLDSMVTLLLVELHHCNKINLPGQSQPSSPCLEFLLSENLLDKLYEWSSKTGRYSNAVLLEQLKLYELLVSHSRHQLLVHESFLRPLLKILASCQNEIFPQDVEKRLVILLNQLCVVLMQNVELLDLFFFSTSQTQQTNAKYSSLEHTNFIIFSLLIPYVHREGTLGHQARDALLLCMALSQKNSNIGIYIAEHSAMCPVLVTGLGGLYSRLPNQIEIKSTDWFRITAEDITELSELTLFMNSLEFCNAVAQAAHPMIREQLLDYMYQGFLVPVLGPTILQIFMSSNFQTNIESQVSAMAYLDLIVRTISEPGMMQIVVRFLLDDAKFDGQRILDVLIERLNTNDSRLCMITLALFDTLLSLNCEDIMLELALKYLINCQHVPISHRYKINRVDSYTNSVEYFLNTTPEVMKKVNSVLWSNAVTNRNVNFSKTIGANWNHYSMNTNGESLLSNYQAYLKDARQKISCCNAACDNWNNRYRYQKNSKNNNLLNNSNNSQMNSLNNEEMKLLRVQMIKNFLAEFSSEEEVKGLMNGATSTSKQMDSLQSLGESSGYESLNVTGSCLGTNGEENRRCESWKVSSIKEETFLDLDLSEDLFAQGNVNLGPFVTAIWGKLQTFTSNCLYVNLHLTGLISHLALYPLPLLHSILLRPDIPTTSDTPSFHQVLKILKQQIDAELSDDESLEVVDIARSFLVDREYHLISFRTKIANESPINGVNNQNGNSNVSSLSAVTPGTTYDPFKRHENKKTSIKTSISNIFRRPGAIASSGLAQIYEFFTGSSNVSSQPNSLSSTTNNNNSMNRQNSRESETQFSSVEPNHHFGPTSATSTGSAVHDFTLVNSTGFVNERQRDLATCAVLLDEWLKELSAITQEHCITMMAESVQPNA